MKEKVISNDEWVNLNLILEHNQDMLNKILMTILNTEHRIGYAKDRFKQFNDHAVKAASYDEIANLIKGQKCMT